MRRYRALRPVKTGGRWYEPGEVFELRGGEGAALESGGAAVFIEELPEAESPTAETPKDGQPEEPPETEPPSKKPAARKKP